MNLKKTLISSAAILVACLVLALIVAFVFPYSMLNSDLQQRAQSELSARGIRSEIKELGFSMPPELVFSRLALDIPLKVATPDGFYLPLSLPLVITDAKFQLSFLSLLLLESNANWNFKLYGGDVTGQSSGAFDFPLQQLKLKLKDVQLGDHPIFQSNALSALVTLDLDTEINPLAHPLPFDSGRAKLKIEQGYYGGGHRINGIVTLPAIEDLELSGDALLGSEQVVVKNVSLTSSLGSAEGSGHFGFTNNLQKIERGTLKAEIHLNEEGKKVFGGYLALASRISIENPPADWKILIRKRARKAPEVTIKPL